MEDKMKAAVFRGKRTFVEEEPGASPTPITRRTRS
jgi:hypothetical protein